MNNGALSQLGGLLGTPRILVAEDDWVARSFIADALDDIGIVVPCSSAEDAESRLSADPEGFDLIISDIVMGGESGLGLLHHVRVSLGLEAIPFLIYTAHGDPEIEEMAFTGGATDLIEKPVSMARLRRRVQANLRIRRANAQDVGAPLDHEGIIRALNTELCRVLTGRYCLSASLVRFHAPPSERLPNVTTALEVAFEFWSRKREQDYMPMFRDVSDGFWVLNMGHDQTAVSKHSDALTHWLESLEDDRRMPQELKIAVGTALVSGAAALSTVDENADEQLAKGLTSIVYEATEEAMRGCEGFVTVVHDISMA